MVAEVVGRLTVRERRWRWEQEGAADRLCAPLGRDAPLARCNERGILVVCPRSRRVAPSTPAGSGVAAGWPQGQGVAYSQREWVGAQVRELLVSGSQPW